MLPDAFKRLKPLYGARIDKLWLEYQLADPERRREIDELLTVLSVRRMGIALGDERIVLEPPPAGTIGCGEYALGLVEYPGMTPYPFRVGRKDLLRHAFILGPTGTGKSTFIIGLLQQLLHDGVPVAVFDFKKNYRSLLLAHHALVVLTVGRETAPLSVNALQAPAGVTPAEWIEALTDIIGTSYLLMQGAKNVLKEALAAALQEHGGDARLHDALLLIRSALATARSGSRRYGWLESTCRSLEELTTGRFGESLNAKRSVPLAEVLVRPVVFELHGTGDDQKRFFCLCVLQYLLLLRKNAPVQREVLRHVLVFDESQHVFPKDQYGTLSIPSRLAREIREYGEGIIAATQQADVAESLIANSGIKIILRCDFPRDVEFASKLLQIEPRWIPRIPLGYGIARLPTRFYTPFLFTFPEQPIKNTTVSEDAVHQRWELFGAIMQPSDKSMPVEQTGAGPRAVALLRDIGEHPISTVTERYDRLGWNPNTGNQVKDDILKQGLAEFELIDVNRGRVKLLTLTPAGEDVVRNNGGVVKRSGRAGMEHEFWRQRLKERYERAGYAVVEEYALGEGKRVDLAATRGEQRFLIEIETGKSDVGANIAKCAGIGATLLVFCTNPATAQGVPDSVACLTPETIDQLNDLLK